MPKYIAIAGLLASTAITLSGCMLASAMFGVAGFMTTGPLQYAGTAYTVGEYTYEYAVNDKHPGDVLKDKFAWLTEFTNTPPLTGYERALAGSTITTPSTEPLSALTARTRARQKPESFPSQSVSVPLPSGRTTPNPNPQPTTYAFSIHNEPAAPLMAQHKQRARPRLSDQPTMEPTNFTKAVPHHTYKAHAPNPMQTRMEQIEQGLAQAERLAARPADQGVIISIPPGEDRTSTSGINGASSIQHHLMDTAITSETGNRDPFILLSEALP